MPAGSKQRGAAAVELPRHALLWSASRHGASMEPGPAVGSTLTPTASKRCTLPRPPRSTPAPTNSRT